MRHRWQLVVSVVVAAVGLTGCSPTATESDGPVQPGAPSLGQRPTSASPTTRPATPAGRASCPAVQILGLRGQGQSLQDAAGVGGEVLGVSRALESRLADRGVSTRLTAVEHPARSGGDAEYAADLRQGVQMTTASIRSVMRRCGQTRVVLVGFSMGAQVVHLTAVALDPGLRSHVAAIGLLGDPLRGPDAAVVHLSLGTGPVDGTGSNGPGPGFGSLTATVVSACVAADNVCNVGPDGRSGGVSQAHREAYETPGAAATIGAALARLLR